MRWLPVLLLLVVPAIPAQGGVLDVRIDSFNFDVAPESWKNQFPPGDASPQTDLDVWSASLGLHLDVALEIRRGGALPEQAWTYEVTLSDGATTVVGLVNPESSGRISVRFDVDGQRAHAGLAAIPRLNAGDWTLQVVASQGTRPEGRGSAVLATQDIEFVKFGLEPTPGIAVPEDLIPHVRELGPGPNTWMPLSAVNGPAVITLEAREATELSFSVWIALPGIDAQAAIVPLPVPDGFDPLATTPLAGNVPTEALTVWLQGARGTATIGAGERVTASVPTVEGPALVILTVHGDRGGLISLVVPVHDGQHRFTDITATPGSEGPVQVGLAGPVDAAVARIHALSQEIPATLGVQRGGTLLASGPLVPAGEDAWIGAYDGTATRRAGVPVVALLAFFQGADGSFAGHAAGLRGVVAELDANTLGAGREGELVLRLAHPQPVRDAALSTPMLVDVTFAGESVGSADLELAAAGTLERTYRLNPATSGAQTAEAVLDTGDLRFSVARTFQVLTPEAYEDATAPWYDVPGPALPLLLVALVALVVRKREI